MKKNAIRISRKNYKKFVNIFTRIALKHGCVIETLPPNKYEEYAYFKVHGKNYETPIYRMRTAYEKHIGMTAFMDFGLPESKYLCERYLKR